MRYREWIFLLAVTGLGMMIANLVGFGVGVGDSLPGVLVLLAISIVAVFLDRVIPIKLPVIAYCSIIGLLLAIPASPVSGFVIEAAGKINFTAPLTMVGSYAGMSISNQLKTFAKQGWKMIIITILVMTGTFVGSLLISQLVLKLTGAI
ncbi:hypothetical protein LJC64_04295 [Ruminococcaceae bacterium OttesenSCG-928-A11]|nr:hypothetical protein [Ruminococcaceae bacterium OttesenSCG-928-A11]